MGLIPPRLHFVGLRKDGTHASVRHIGFHRDFSSGHGMATCIGQHEGDNDRANVDGLRLDLELDHYGARGIGRPVTTNSDRNRDDHQNEATAPRITGP